MKKDWDEDVIVDNGKCLATDLRGQESFWLEETSNLSYNPDEYMVSKTNTKNATKKINNYQNTNSW